MTDSLSRGMTTALLALAVSAILLMCMRIAERLRRGPHSSRELPAWIRSVWWMAALLEPLVSLCLPEGARIRNARLLASLDLDPFLTPARWIATRAAFAALLAGAALLFMLLLGTAVSLPTVATFCAACAWSGLWLNGQRRRRDARIARELPSYLDLLTVSIEAGSSLTAGIRLIVERSPGGPLRSYFERVLREIRGGRSRAQAFAGVADVYGVPALTSLATALTHGETSGMSLGSILRAQGVQRNAERFAAAEKLAMQAPVKLLGPLILCIFPCTFIVLAIPILVRLREAFAS